MRGILMDTHAVLWYLQGDARRFPRAARRRVEESGLEVFVSAVSIWEIAIKGSLGRLDVDDDLLERIDAVGFARLNVTPDHAFAVRRLPDIHRDPFDRLLVAQAQVEGLLVLTADPTLAEYDVPTGWG